MNKPPYSTEDLENLLSELAAHDRQCAPMRDAFTEKMLRLIDEETERSMTRRLYTRLAQVAACVAVAAVPGVVLMYTAEKAPESAVCKAPEPEAISQPLPHQIALNELDALKNSMPPARVSPHPEDDSSSAFSGHFQITVCVDTL